MKPHKVYVASSWRNPVQPAVCQVLKAANIDYYDFRHPAPGNDGFHWSQVMPSWRAGVADGIVPVEEYLTGLEHPIAEQGFKFDYDAMKECGSCVMVLPCGRSAHLELGWFVGQHRPTAILLDSEPEMIPELMYKMVDFIAPDVMALLGWLGVED